MSSHFLASWTRAVACVASIVAVVACGGGGGSVGSGGTGSPIGTAQGTVNGFGSIFVDGERFDDHNAPAFDEDAGGHDVAAEAKLGHRVEIEFEQDGVARTLRIDGALLGTVSSKSPAQLVVLGQIVRVNDDPTKGPVTQFGGGYASLADVNVNDAVDVHGVLVPQAQGAIIQATRIERVSVLPFLKVTGIVSALNGSTFQLGTLTVTTTADTIVVPAGAALANGQAVKVLAPTAAASGSTLAASLVRVKRLPQDGHTAVVGGTIASLDTTAHTFLVGTQKVDYATAQLLPAGATPDNGQYVRVRGSLGNDGTLVATQVVIRDGHGDEAQAELHGNIGNFDATAKTFTIRDVKVDMNGVTLQNCPASGLANGLFVEVEGTLSSTTVMATRIQCEGEPAGGTVEREGTAGNVSPSAKTFDLTTAGGKVSVTWSDTTFFRDVTPATINGQRVEVEGVLNGTTLAASKVKLAH